MKSATKLLWQKTFSKLGLVQSFPYTVIPVSNGP